MFQISFLRASFIRFTREIAFSRNISKWTISLASLSFIIEDDHCERIVKEHWTFLIDSSRACDAFIGLLIYECTESETNSAGQNTFAVQDHLG